MSQQINLYAPLRVQQPTAAMALLAAGIAALTMGAVSGYLAWMNASLREGQAFLSKEIEHKQLELAGAKRRLDEMKKLVAGMKEAEKPVIEEARARLQKLQKFVGELPAEVTVDTRSYVGHLRTLASFSADGVWITGLDIEDAGKTVRISGKSLRRETILGYARRASERFSPLGVSFVALTVRPLAQREDGVRDAGFEFELSSKELERR